MLVVALVTSLQNKFQKHVSQGEPHSHSVLYGNRGPALYSNTCVACCGKIIINAVPVGHLVWGVHG